MLYFRIENVHAATNSLDEGGDGEFAGKTASHLQHQRLLRHRRRHQNYSRAKGHGQTGGGQPREGHHQQRWGHHHEASRRRTSGC